MQVPHQVYLDLAFKLRTMGEAPRAWARMVTGSVRNPWRDIWIRRGVSESWTRASAWRNAAQFVPERAHTDRRRQSRRITD